MAAAAAPPRKRARTADWLTRGTYTYRTHRQRADAYVSRIVSAIKRACKGIQLVNACGVAASLCMSLDPIATDTADALPGDSAGRCRDDKFGLTPEEAFDRDMAWTEWACAAVRTAILCRYGDGAAPRHMFSLGNARTVRLYVAITSRCAFCVLNAQANHKCGLVNIREEYRNNGDRYDNMVVHFRAQDMELDGPGPCLAFRERATALILEHAPILPDIVHDILSGYI